MSQSQTKNGIPMIRERKKINIVKKGDKPGTPSEKKNTPITGRTVHVDGEATKLPPKPDRSQREFIPTFVDKKDDVIQDIRLRKDFKSLFSPLQFPEIKSFQATLHKAVPAYDPDKLTKNVVHQLKLMAYFKELKGKDRKYLPKDSDKIKILQLAMIEDLTTITDYDFYDILNKLKTITKNEFFLKIVYGLEDIKMTMDNYSLVTHVTNFDHYDIVIKYHRTLQKPVIHTVVQQILLEIDNTKLPNLNSKDYDKIMLVFNLIGKMGLNYCNSRSNLEWAIYNKTLRRIRNFFSKNTYDSFKSTVSGVITHMTREELFEKTLYGFDKIFIPYFEKEKEKAQKNKLNQSSRERRK